MDETEERVCRQRCDDRYAWPSSSLVTEGASTLGTFDAYARRDHACWQSAPSKLGSAVAIAPIRARASWARHDCFGSRGCSGVAMPMPRLRQSCRPRGRDRLRSPSCALATAGATDRRPPARDAAVANARSARESPTVELAVPGLPLVLKARPPGARTSRGMLGLVAYDPRLSGTSGGCRLRPLSSRGMSGVDRVRERRRAAALARHYRDLEALSIKEIARRLGRAEATVKAYLYDPSDANKGPYTSLGATRAVYGAPRRRKPTRATGPSARRHGVAAPARRPIPSGTPRLVDGAVALRLRGWLEYRCSRNTT